LSPVTDVEAETLSAEQLKNGYRLACQAYPAGDVRIEIPPESMPVVQRLQVDGQEILFDLDPAVLPLDLDVPVPENTDLRSDFTRVDQEVQKKGFSPLHADLAGITRLSEMLRAQDWKVRLAVSPGDDAASLVTTLPWGTALYGLAVDMGSTKLALYLVDLGTGITAAKTGVMNPQIAFGEDIVSRIAFANQGLENQALLQTRLVDTLNQAIAGLCFEAGIARSQVVDAVLVGNTAMHHFFCRLPVRQLGTAPYVPAVTEPLDILASEVGLAVADGARLHTPANIAGYIGGDHTSALLSIYAEASSQRVVLVDIGTNTEISLIDHGRIFSCSTASGPAFEGAHIKDGMRASPGAIEKVRIEDGKVHVTTIGRVPAVGICGTGILSGIAELLDAQIIDRRGSMNRMHEQVRMVKNNSEFVLVPAQDPGIGKDIVITRKDVHEIQLAKSAIRTGINVLLQTAGIAAEDVERWIIAGAFGTFLDLDSAVRIGMFPDVPLERYHQVGNAAGAGAKMMLLSKKYRASACQLAGEVSYIELTIYPGFSDSFIQAMYFEKEV
jgi:uncharacterized 2Fe-2S/4Fe-4S cluster protein (DUF4445 family)